MRRKFTWLFCSLALLAVPLVLAQDIVWGGDDDNGNEDDSPGYWVFNADDSAFLGVTMEEETENEAGGARITSVVDGSPAEKAGLEKGDIVVAFGGDTVRGPVSLTKKIRDHEPGDSVKLTVLRDGRRQSFDVELARRSAQWSGAYSVAPRMLGQLREIEIPEVNVDLEKLAERLADMNLDLGDLPDNLAKAYSLECEGDDCDMGSFFEFSGRPRLGVQLTETTPELREHLGGSADAGVLIGKVIEGSAAEIAGVQVGDLIVAVDGEKVSGTNALRKALSKRDGKTFDIEVIRRGDSMRLSVTLEERKKEERFTGPRAEYRRVPLPAPALAPAFPAPAPAAHFQDVI